MSQVDALGIVSIICLLSETQLGRYADLPDGLIDYYRHHGFAVEHVPIVDPHRDATGWQQLEDSLADIFIRFDRLPKPVLVHLQRRNATNRARH